MFSTLFRTVYLHLSVCFICGFTVPPAFYPRLSRRAPICDKITERSETCCPVPFPLPSAGKPFIAADSAVSDAASDKETRQINNRKFSGDFHMIQTLQTVGGYRDELIYPALCQSFGDLEIEKDLRPGMKVVIKPNLVMAKSPESSATTHPLVIRGVVRWLRERGVTDITVAESSGGLYNAEHMSRVYRTCGMDSLEPDACLNRDFTSRTVSCPAGFANRSFNLITPVLQADYIINICKLKTHAMTGYSGGIKNLFGTVPGLEKPQLHYRWPDIDDFSRMLLEVAQIVNPQLTVIDAVEAMEGNGPTGGTTRPMHMLLAARDFYTQDYFAAKLMGLEPMEISMIRQSVEQGLAHPGEITLRGDDLPADLPPFRVPDTKSLNFADNVPPFLRRPFVFFASKLLKSYPLLKKDVCIGCGKCAESCPARVIRIEKGKAIFKKRGCISCFCCQEMCPAKAISVRKAL